MCSGCFLVNPASIRGVSPAALTPTFWAIIAWKKGGIFGWFFFDFVYLAVCIETFKQKS